MTEQELVSIFLSLMTRGVINPSTGAPIALEDIKQDDFKAAVVAAL